MRQRITQQRTTMTEERPIIMLEKQIEDLETDLLSASGFVGATVGEQCVNAIYTLPIRVFK